MLEYGNVLRELRLKINAYSKKKKQTDSDERFYSDIICRLSLECDSIESKGVEETTQKELQSAVDLLREVRQRRVVKICQDNKWYIGFGIYFLGFMSANIYFKLKKS